MALFPAHSSLSNEIKEFILFSVGDHEQNICKLLMWLDVNDAVECVLLALLFVTTQSYVNHFHLDLLGLRSVRQ